ncbi:MAG: hypothetical protein U0744_01550 [Gemmataceae bacterium]
MVRFPALTVGGVMALLSVGALLLPRALTSTDSEIQKQIDKPLVELAQDENPPRRKEGDRPKEGPRDGDQPKKGPVTETSRKGPQGRRWPEGTA